MYAILETGGKQYRVAPGATIDIETIEAKAGDSFTFDRVLLVENDGNTSVGTPTVANASITAQVIEHLKGPKLIAFKMRRRKGSKRTVGHRQRLTRVKISEIKA